MKRDVQSPRMTCSVQGPFIHLVECSSGAVLRSRSRPRPFDVSFGGRGVTVWRSVAQSERKLLEFGVALCFLSLLLSVHTRPAQHNTRDCI